MSVVYDEKLLDKVGMAMVPSGYSNTPDENNAGGQIGKLYSVLPIESSTDEFLNSSTLNGLSIPSSYDTTYPLYAQGTGGWVRIDFTQTITSGSRLRYILRNGDNTDNVAILDNNLSNTYANGSGSFFYYLKIDDGLQVRILSETNTGTLDSFTSTLTQNGDFQFSRGSDATRINSQGLVESVQVIGEDLVQNGDFEEIGSELISNGDFEEIGSETVNNGTFDTDISGWVDYNSTSTWDNGTIKAETSTANYYTTAFIRQNGGLTQSRQYKITFRAKSTNITSQITIWDTANFINTGLYFNAPDTWQEFTYYIIATGPSTHKIIGQENLSQGDAINFDNVSYVETGPGWINTQTDWLIADGQLTLKSGTIRTNYDAAEAGKFYRLQYDVVNVVGTSELRYYNGVSYIEIPQTVGTHTVYFKRETSSNLKFYISNSFNAQPGAEITIDNISVKEVGQNWNIIGDVIINNGAASFVDTGSNTFSRVQQSILSNTKKYKVSFDVTRYVSGRAQVIFGADASTVNVDISSGVGTYTATATSVGNNFFIKRNGAYAGFDFDIDNISVKQITDDTDVPRLDYTNAACPSLLLEPQRQNIVTYSEIFNSSSTYYFGPLGTTIESTNNLAPDGKNTATQIVSDGQGKIQTVYKTLPANTTYTLSVWVKNIDATSYETRILANGGSGGTNIAQVNRINEISKNYWTRITHTFTTHTTEQNYIMYICNNVSTGQKLQLWGAQLEASSYATSYIPTSGTAATRLPDICEDAGHSGVFNGTEGTLYTEVKLYEYDEGATMIFTVTDKTQSNVVWIYKNSNGQFQAIVAGGGSSAVAQVLNWDARKDFIKIALKYDINSVKVFMDGVKVSSDITVSGLPTGLHTAAFNRGDGIYPMLGFVKGAYYFDKALSDAELEYITSSNIDLTIHNYKGSLSKISATYEDVGVKDRLTKLF